MASCLRLLVRLCCTLLLIAPLAFTPCPVYGQLLTPTFTYQGELRLSTGPATGLYDMEFRLFDANAGGFQVGPTVTRNSVFVVDGLFSVPLDFGTSSYPGIRQWLEVRIAQSGGAFETLTPRTEVTATPYSWVADSVINDATGNDWRLSGNAGTDPARDFIGTTDNQPVVIRTAGARSLLIEPSSEMFEGLPATANVIAGSHANFVADGVRGATIAGGGVPENYSDPDIGPPWGPNRVTDLYSTVGGGLSNLAGDSGPSTSSSAFATISGGQRNTVSGSYGTISGGLFNDVFAVQGTIGGGAGNDVSERAGTVGGGTNNEASGSFATVGGGSFNTASGEYSTVDGGMSNCAGGAYSWAGGRQAIVRPGSASGDYGAGCLGIPLSGTTLGDQGTFVWSGFLNGGAEFISTGPNQFLVRAQGGMAINTNAPRASLTVQGEDRWNPTLGDGFGDFHIGNQTLGLAVGVALTGAGAGAVRFWPTGGNEQIIFTTASNHPVPTLTMSDAGRVGIRRSASSHALEIEGNASKTAPGGWIVNSDRRIKTQVTEISGALDRLMQVRPVTFQYNEAYRRAHPSAASDRHYNVIAQEFARVFPEAVRGSGEYLPGQPRSADNEILQVDIHPALITSIAALQELGVRVMQSEQENAELRRDLERLEAQVAALVCPVSSK